jgi:hypothetical protein
MAARKDLGRDLRALCATLAVICLLGAGVAYGATRYLQTELEADATRDARKLTMDVLRPLLLPRDATAPIRAARYEEFLDSVHERVLAGPIVGLKLWAADGTILFATNQDQVGDREPAMREDLHDVIGGASRSVVEGDRFRTFTSMRIGEPPTIVTAELVRSHAAIVEKSRERWYPWVPRALMAAAVFAAFYVATAILFAIAAALRRWARRRKVSGREAPPIPGSRAGRPAEDLPAYMTPGFREMVESRQEMELEMATALQERDELATRLRGIETQTERGDAQG